MSFAARLLFEGVVFVLARLTPLLSMTKIDAVIHECLRLTFKETWRYFWCNLVLYHIFMKAAK